MGKFVLKDAYVEVDGTELSNRASSVTINTPADEIDFTTFSDAGFREFGQGLKDATITIAFFQDYAAGSTHSVLGPLHESGDTFDLVIRPVNAAASATNPEWTMTSRLYDYSPLAAGVGEAATMDVSFRNADTAGIVEATA